jgi:queuine tRNA-ribosyltransferase
MKFIVTKQSKKTLARSCEIETSHGKIKTPVFMPCATSGSVKGISPEELNKIGFQIILGNTYHLYLNPGERIIKKSGKIQKWMNWKKPVLTDSGGYQVFSLGKNYNNFENHKEESLVKVTSRGVWFRSHKDNSKHLFTPESVIDIQRNLGSDILMVLDECTEYPATYERTRESLKRTHAWAKRAIDYWKKTGHSNQAIFGIVQGSTHKDLRLESLDYISNLPFDGIAVGGVSVGEGKENMYKVIKWLSKKLPKDKPRYLMGVGEPEDIIFAINNGFDMFDCVLPTRLGRHGTVWITKNYNKFQKIDLRKGKYLTDTNPIMKNCGCPACSGGYSRAYISHLIKEKEMLGMRLASLHNLWVLNKLTEKLRENV